MSAAAIDPAVVDVDRLADWLTSQGVMGRVESPRLLTAGTQNILVRFRIDGRDVVLRRPPLKPRPRNDELLLRETRVLRALDGSGVPHPAVVAVCDDPAVLGNGVFYVMEAVEGFNPAESGHEVFADQTARDTVAGALIDVLADLGRVDHRQVGLADFGRPEGFLERQTERWAGDYEAYSGLDGYPGDPLPGFDAVRDYLAANVPRGFRPGIMHGDYHPGNVICADDLSIAAVVDWEMATIGDPLLDLGRHLAMWPDEQERIVDGVALWDAGPVPSAGELAARYGARSERSLDDLPWYVVMGCFKLGIVLEGTHARACAGLAPRSTGELFHGIAIRLFTRASRLIGAPCPTPKEYA